MTANYCPNSENMKSTGKTRDKDEETNSVALLAVVVTLGAGKSPTVSFKKLPNLDVLAKVLISVLALLTTSIIIKPAWNQDESELHIRGPPSSPCKTREQKQRSQKLLTVRHSIPSQYYYIQVDCANGHAND